MDQGNPGQIHSIPGVVVAQQHVFETRWTSLQGSYCSHVVSSLICSSTCPPVLNEDVVIRSLRVAVPIADSTWSSLMQRGVKADMCLRSNVYIRLVCNRKQYCSAFFCIKIMRKCSSSKLMCWNFALKSLERPDRCYILCSLVYLHFHKRFQQCSVLEKWNRKVSED